MPYTQIYNFPEGVRGDSYNDIQFTIALNGSPQDLTGVIIRMWLLDSADTKLTQQPSAEFTTLNNKITLISPTIGIFKTNFGIITLSPKIYKYDLEIKFPNGIVKTWIKGTFTIINDVTK